MNGAFLRVETLRGKNQAEDFLTHDRQVLRGAVEDPGLEVIAPVSGWARGGRRHAA